MIYCRSTSPKLRQPPSKKKRVSQMARIIRLFADAWAFVVDSEAREVYRPGEPGKFAMSVREARQRGILAPKL